MKKLVVLTGAGVSAESGISTFRDSNGLWENYNVEDVATIEGWWRNRALVLEFYNQRRGELATKKPNEAHKLIASLEKDYDVTVVTQNIDNLHEQGGSTKIIHLHGEATKVRPEDADQDCRTVDVGYAPVNLGDTDSRGVQLRPNIVWFGEAVPKFETAARIASEADIMLIVGTSMQVYPAAGLVQYARPGIPIYLIDPKPVYVAASNFTQITDVATRGMEKFIELLKIQKI
ncbi:MAG: NAD-dependent deacylase [Bacteroidales bacterium]|nr:NAD-dependent deacylase [Bacteroidales bacterium]